MSNSYTRIKPPKFRIGKYVLNEYELRTLMAEVAEGKRPAGIMVKEGNQTAKIRTNGSLSVSLPGLIIAPGATLRMLAARRKAE